MKTKSVKDYCDEEIGEFPLDLYTNKANPPIINANIIMEILDCQDKRDNAKWIDKLIKFGEKEGFLGHDNKGYYIKRSYKVNYEQT